jgi:glycerate kinase
VSVVRGAGAAGGLGGGLAALGGRIVPGFELVAGIVGLRARLAGADLVVTGEGHLDPPSLTGKVVGEVLRDVDGRAPVLCVVGDADPTAVAGLPGRVVLVNLAHEAGPQRARREVVSLVEATVFSHLGTL